MCLPLLPALAAIGQFATSAAGMATMAVASTAATIATQAEQASYQNKAITTQLNQGEQQVEQAEATQLQQRQRESYKEQGRMMVAAGQAGLQLDSGSVESMLMDSQMQSTLDSDNIKQNAQNQDQNLQSEANRYYSQVQSPSVIGAGLRLVTAGVGGFAQGTNLALKANTISAAAANQVTI